MNPFLPWLTCLARKPTLSRYSVEQFADRRKGRLIFWMAIHDQMLRPALECLPTEPPVLDRKFITLTWAEPLPGRGESYLRLAIMQAVARLRACGIPVLRWHSDRAKEFSSKRLAEWMKTQGILDTKSTPEHHEASGRAEAAVREIKGLARRCLLSARLPSALWPLAIRQASERSWR